MPADRSKKQSTALMLLDFGACSTRASQLEGLLIFSNPSDTIQSLLSVRGVAQSPQLFSLLPWHRQTSAKQNQQHASELCAASRDVFLCA